MKTKRRLSHLNELGFTIKPGQRGKGQMVGQLTIVALVGKPNERERKKTFAKNSIRVGLGGVPSLGGTVTIYKRWTTSHKT